MIIKKILLLIFCFAYLTAWSDEIKNDDFKLRLYGDWIKVTDEVLREYEKDVSVLSGGKDNTVYQYGFQQKDARSFTSGPYILIKVQRLLNAQEVDGDIIKEFDKSVSKVMDVGNAAYNDIHKYYWSYYNDKNNQAEGVRILLIQKLTVYGKVSIFFHAKKTEFKKYKPLFKKISYSLSIKKKDDLQLKRNELMDERLSQEPTSGILMKIFWGVITSVVLYVLKRIFFAKEHRQDEARKDLALGDSRSRSTKVEPKEVLIENDSEHLVDDDRRGVLFSENQECFISDDLQEVLLIANYQIGKISGSVSLLLIIIGVGFSVFLYSGYLEEQMKLNLSKLHVWTIYMIIPCVVLSLSSVISYPFRKRMYVKHRSDFLAIAKQSGVNKYELITLIDEYREFRNLSFHLKLDVENEWV